MKTFLGLIFLIFMPKQNKKAVVPVEFQSGAAASAFKSLLGKLPNDAAITRNETHIYFSIRPKCMDSFEKAVENSPARGDLAAKKIIWALRKNPLEFVRFEYNHQSGSGLSSHSVKIARTA